MPDQPIDRPRLFTWSWKKALAYEGDDVVLVRISLGKPKWLMPRIASEFPYIPELAPAGGFHIRNAAAFRNFYWERLDSFGVDRLERKFAELLERNGGRPLLLLCFEAELTDCHRSDFAAYWLEKTGEVVPEFDPAVHGAGARPAVAQPTGPDELF